MAALAAAPSQALGPVLLSDLAAGTGFGRLAVWSGRARDYSGRYWDIDHHYLPQSPSHYFRVGMLVGVRPDLLVNATAYLDTGLDAAAMRVDGYASVSLTLVYLPRRDVTLSLGVRDLVQVGGEVRERPCRDAFLRAFHCGTALPWTDYLPQAPDFDTPRSIFGRIEYRF
jgi:hypothetical protein